jgi:hypothetical protein
LPRVHLFKGIDEVLTFCRRGSAPMLAEHEAADRGHVEVLPEHVTKFSLFLSLGERGIVELGEDVMGQRFKERTRSHILAARQTRRYKRDA